MFRDLKPGNIVLDGEMWGPQRHNALAQQNQFKCKVLNHVDDLAFEILNS